MLKEETMLLQNCYMFDTTKEDRRYHASTLKHFLIVSQGPPLASAVTFFPYYIVFAYSSKWFFILFIDNDDKIGPPNPQLNICEASQIIVYPPGSR